MKRRIISFLMAAIMVISASFVGGSVAVYTAPTANAEETGEWIAAWGTGLTNISLSDYKNIAVIAGKVSVRIVLTPTASGSKVRFKLSNKYGTQTLSINRATVAKSAGGSKMDKKTCKQIYVNGERTNFDIPPGEEIYTDPVDFDVKAQEPIAVTLYVSDYQEITTVGLSGGSAYLARDNITWTETPDISLMLKYNLVNAIPVLGSMDVFSEEPDPYSIVVIGDSTVSNNVPLYLSRLINAEDCTNVGVVGKGIIGNSLASDGQGLIGNIYGPSVLNRMDKDVLEQPGVRYAIIKIGANDITHPESASIHEYGNYIQPTADDLIEAFKEFINTCHDNNIKVVACSITQWKGTTRNYFGKDEYQWNDNDWQIAVDVNEWLSTTDMLDGFVELNEISADPNDPEAFRADLSDDKIHPNDTLQQMWAKQIPLKLLGLKTLPKSVKLDRTSATLAVGKTIRLNEKISPSDSDRKAVKWTSSNPKVATVDGDGLVKAISNGSANITCTTVNGKTAVCKVKVVTFSTGVKLSASSLNLYTTQKASLKATVSPSAATDKSVKWSSSNQNVATVSSSGVVTAVGKGTATITCKTSDTGKTASCKVNVTKKIDVKSLALNKSSKTIYKGSTYQLKANINPSNASNKKVSWKSTNTSVATVLSTGLVTAKGNGTAKIICTTHDGNFTSVCKVTVKTKVSGVSLDRSKASIYVGGKKQLNAEISPSSASDKSVKWKSSDKSVATVDSNGVVKGKSAGTAVITCTTNDGSYKASCVVAVNKYVDTKSVKLNKSSKTLYVTDKYTLKATVSPSNASNKGVKWSSSDKSVAKVSSSGVVTAVGKGTATITCKTKDGGYKATCKITVKKIDVTGLSISDSSIKLNIGETERLYADVKPSEASNQEVTWSSSDKSVAKVSSTGKVTAVGTGSAVITCKTKDGGYKKTCKVKVSSNIQKDPNQKVIGVKMSKSGISIKAGSNHQLTAKVLPANAANQKVKWTSSNPLVATVSKNGTVTAKSKGRTTISVVTDDGGCKSTCIVNVV
ncbi:MAG: Ig-like domain-containing protein [Acutalibacteraceae bacterium]